MEDHLACRPRSISAAALLLSLALASCSGPTSSSSLPGVAAAARRQSGAGVRTPGASSIAVTTLNDSGPGSLRAALASVNAKKAGRASITFTVAGTIALASNLPSIAAPVTVDGTSAPTYSGGAPVIGIDARGHAGLIFGTASAGSQLVAVSVGGAKSSGVELDAGSIALNRDYIGLNVDGKSLPNKGDGVYVSAASSGDRIGFNASGAAGAVSNVISSNGGNGVSLNGASGNTVADNRIGTDPTGETAMANRLNGILIASGAHDNEIGGIRFVDSATGKINNPTGNKGTKPPVFVVPPDGNLISGNTRNGVLIQGGAQNNELNGNFIGTTADGDAALGNGLNGVWIKNADGNSLVGCKFRNNPFVYYNVASGNGTNGVRVTNSNEVVIQGNFFGIAANNTDLVPNKRDGMRIDGSSKDTTVGGVIPLGNVSAGNGANGIELKDSASGFTTFNTFGGLLAFKGAAPNGNDGLLITSTGGDQTVRTNVLSGNAKYGLEISGNASGVTVDPNIIGLNTVGNAVLANGSDGVHVGGTAHDIVIGGYEPSVIPENTFSGNGGYGLSIAGRAHNVTVFNTFVGTNVLGTAAVANGKGGLYVGGSANHELIGGAGGTQSEPRRNLVSGNTGNGITLDNGTSYIRVIENWVGLNRRGAKTLPNSGTAIVKKSGSTHDTIKGNKT